MPLLSTEVRAAANETKEVSADVEPKSEVATEAINEIKQASTTTATDEKVSLPTKPVKKRKSASFFSCFGNKKSKASTEQQGQPIVEQAKQTSTDLTIPSPAAEPAEEKPKLDYAILPDGKRIYIDAFRDRPGLDMSYQPNDFDTRFTMPIVRIDKNPK